MVYPCSPLPPKCVPPAVAFNSNTPSSIDNKLTSTVPHPKSNINTFCSSSEPDCFLSKLYSIAAAVGSLIIRPVYYKIH